MSKLALAMEVHIQDDIYKMRWDVDFNVDVSVIPNMIIN
jgi:hypothetical protein